MSACRKASATALSGNSIFQPQAESYKRPPAAEGAINASFARIANKAQQSYLYTGSDRYGFYLDKLSLLSDSHLIFREVTQTRNLVVLDIGAGDFSFSATNQKNYDKKIKSYGLIAEPLPKADEYQRVGNAEFLSTYFQENFFDYIFSEKTFIHFVDPVGALIEAYRSLKPGGVLIVDRLYLMGCEHSIPELLMALTAAGYLCVGDCNPITKSLTNFVLQKSNTRPCLEFPVIFSHLGHDQYGEARVIYRPTHKVSTFYPRAQYLAKGRQMIQQQLQVEEGLGAIFKQNKTLAALLTNSTYQGLPPLKQHFLILALVAGESYKEEAVDLSEEQKNTEKQAAMKLQGIHLLFALFEEAGFQFLNPQEQSLKIEFAAKEGLIRLAQQQEAKECLKTMGLPFEEELSNDANHKLTLSALPARITATL